MKILPVPHIRQPIPGLCLPTCAQMVLAYLGLAVSQDALIKQLGARTRVGVPYSRVTRLEALGVNVTLAVGGDLDDLRKTLERGLPVILFVEAGELPYCRGIVSPHAVVMVGMDDQVAQVLDPATLRASDPIVVPLDELMLAWDEMDNAYAVLSLH